MSNTLFLMFDAQALEQTESCNCSSWKVWVFSQTVTQILREINFGDPRSGKYAILTHLETLNFDFYAFLHF